MTLTMAETLRVARAHLEATRPELALDDVTFDDALLFDADGRALPIDVAIPGPFVVAVAVPESDGGKGPRAPRPALLVDARTGRVHDRDPAGFVALLAALGWAARPDVLRPDALVGLWVAAAHGEEARVVSAVSRSDPRLRLVVGPPRLDRDDDGARTLVGWTAAPRDLDLVRHTVRLSPGGEVVAWRADDEDAALE